MSKLKLIPAWGWATAILLVAAVIFRFALRGYLLAQLADAFDYRAPR